MASEAAGHFGASDISIDDGKKATMASVGTAFLDDAADDMSSTGSVVIPGGVP